MLTEYHTKDIKPETAKTKTEENYFFPGGQEFMPMTVKAANREEAEKVWEKEKKPVTK